MYFLSIFLIIQLFINSSFARTTSNDTNKDMKRESYQVSKNVIANNEGRQSENAQIPNTNNEYSVSEEDVFKFVNGLIQRVDSLYDDALGQLDTWSNNEILSPFENRAKTGLTLAKEQLNDSTDDIRARISASINKAKDVMEPNEFQEYLNNMPSFINTQITPTVQYFQNALNAIKAIGTQTNSQNQEIQSKPVKPKNGTRSVQPNNLNNRQTTCN